jgi:outer membrane protein|nr:OmpH family outer membrane protein [uncultured Prevotella sp.]
MKQILLPLVFMLMPVAASAQQSAHPQVSAPVEQSLRFGYFSYEEVLHTMPGYAIAKHNMDDLRAKYDAETKRAEDEFNAKYEEFLDGQRSFAPSILEKRQAELRELMAKNVTFKAEAVRLLQQADAEAYAPLKAQIDAAVQKVGKVKGLAFILNTDKGAFPYVNALCGEDVTLLIKENLK